MLYLGVDPGTTNNMAIAALLPTGELRVRLVEEADHKEPRGRASGAGLRTRVALAQLHLPDEQAPFVALEWQRPLPTDKNPKNICDLSAFAGIALAAVEQFFYPKEARVYTPLPEEWKGSIPKHVKHNRIVAVGGQGNVETALRAAGIPVPANLGKFTKEFTGMAGNALDAIGLAQWMKVKSLTLLRSVVPG